VRARSEWQHPSEILWRQRDPHRVDLEFSPCATIGARAGGVVQAECEARELGYNGGAAVLHVRWDKELLRAHLLIWGSEEKA